MNTILALAMVFTAVAPSQPIKEVVQFEQVKLRSYKEAHAEHEKTKRPVIVWVNQVNLEAWRATKDLGIHCYMREFPGNVRVGAVIGKDYKGQFCRFGEVEMMYERRAVQIQLLVDGIKTCLDLPEPMQLAPASPPPSLRNFNPFQDCPIGNT